MSGYIGTQPVPQATQTRDAFTCTAGQTSFATSGYTPGYLDVYLNGIKLAAADYTASNGSDVVLASGAALDDILEVVAYTSFKVVTDTVTNAGTVLNLDRTGSDGTILDLKKDGTTVGTIGTLNDDLIVGETAACLRFDGENEIIAPSFSTAISDARIRLGSASQRFTDLYLSGGVYLGGTGAANKLDDYEEGTSTITLRGGTSEPATLLTTTCYYTKIGTQVSIQFQMENVNTTGYSGDLYFTGLPFANTGISRAVINIAFYSMATWTDNVMGIIDANQTQLQPRDIRSNATWAAVNHAAGSSRYVWVTGHYKN